MDIFSCESQMTAASYSDENTHRWSRVLLLSGSIVGPSDPNNNEPELGFPDTNIYLLFLEFFHVSKLIKLFGIWRLQ